MAKLNNSQSVQSVDGGVNSGKRCDGFRLVKKTFEAPTEGLQHIIFNYSARKNNKNVVKSVKKLIQYIAVSGSIRHDALAVAYPFSTLTAPVFEVPADPEKDYNGGYG